MINYYLKPTDPPAPRFYVQPKVHKAGVPIRPVVSYKGSQLCNYKANILKVYVKNENSNVKNSTRFSKNIKNLLIEYGKIMVSFDVTPVVRDSYN